MPTRRPIVRRPEPSRSNRASTSSATPGPGHLVGKAKSLRPRLNSYFADVSALHPRTRQMVTSAASVEWTIVTTEVEALQLEYNWIKEFDPRFNVRYRDDKSYPSLAVTLNEEYPRLQVMRGPKKPGPVLRPVRARLGDPRDAGPAAAGVPCAYLLQQGVRAGRPDWPAMPARLHRQVQRPCVDRVSAEEHREIVEDFCDFMAGKTDDMIRGWRSRWRRERGPGVRTAARLRDDLGALRRWMEERRSVLRDSADADVVTFATDELSAAVQVFHVRGGPGARPARLGGGRRGRAGPGHRAVRHQGAGRAVRAAVLRPTDDRRSSRARCWCRQLPDDHEALAELLAEIRGSRVSLRIPQRGDKRSLMQTVAAQRRAGVRCSTSCSRASDLTARSQALAELQEALDMPDAPLRIECFDISHVQGTNVVASMVVFEDGLARKSEYRRFAMRESGGDTDWIAEVIRRRFARLPARDRPAVDAGSASRRRTPVEPRPAGSRRSRRPHRPIDPLTGPAAQSSPTRRTWWWSTAARRRSRRPRRCSTELGITDVTLVGLAKRLEEVWLPEEDVPGDPAAHAPRRCTCCSGSATRRTGSPSPSTGRSGRSR